MKVASAEVALRFKVGPLNETKKFCLNDVFVGLHLLAEHRFEVRRFVKECVRANLSAPPNLFPTEAYGRTTPWLAEHVISGAVTGALCGGAHL